MAAMAGQAGGARWLHRVWLRLGGQLRHPSGGLGTLLGHLMRRINADPNRLTITALAPRAGDTVLELGFGPGHGVELALAAVGPGGTVHGIDQSAAMAAQARRRNRAAVAAGRAHLHLGRFDSLPLPAATIDKVLAVNVAYFWDDASTVLREVRRVLRPGGVLALYVTDAATMRRWPFADAATHRLFDHPALTRILITGGFAPEDIEIRDVRLTGGVAGWIALARRPRAPFIPLHRIS